MRKSRFREKLTIGILREHPAGLNAAESGIPRWFFRLDC